MSQELLRLLPNEHRSLDDDLYVVLQRSVNASKPKDGVSLVRLRYDIIPLNYVIKAGDKQKVVPFAASTTFDAIVDKDNRTIEFSINEAKAALPDELQGSGVGSYVLSEMIRWGQAIASDLQVVPILISTPENQGSGREAKLKAFFSQLGFVIVNKPGKGIYAAAEAVGNLKTHVNFKKIEQVSLVSWGNEWLDKNLALANQLKDEIQNNNIYRDQIDSLRAQQTRKQPFWAGVLVGLVAGLVVGFLIGL